MDDPPRQYSAAPDGRIRRPPGRCTSMTAIWAAALLPRWGERRVAVKPHAGRAAPTIISGSIRASSENFRVFGGMQATLPTKAQYPVDFSPSVGLGSRSRVRHLTRIIFRPRLVDEAAVAAYRALGDPSSTKATSTALIGPIARYSQLLGTRLQPQSLERPRRPMFERSTRY